MRWIGFVLVKESPESRVARNPILLKAGPFNEMVVMGVLAVRLQGLNKELEWNGEKMEFTNINDLNNSEYALKMHSQLQTGIRHLTRNGLTR